MGKTYEPTQYENDMNTLNEYARNLQAKEQAVNNGMYSQLQQQDAASTREFYLSYEDVIDEQIQMWRGLIKQGDQWIEPDPKNVGGSRIMSEPAISIIVGMMRSFLSIPNRLSNQEETFISSYAFQARKHISKFLHTKGWIDFKIPIAYLGQISFQAGQTIHSALTWSRNGGGQRFMTRSIVSHENVTQITANRGGFDGGKKRGAEGVRPW